MPPGSSICSSSRRAASPPGRGARRRRSRASRISATCGLEAVSRRTARPGGGSGTTGNPLAGWSRPPRGTPIFLCAHLDTVPPTGPIEPVVEDGVIRNAAGTILGADNKSAVAAMLEGVRAVLAEGRPHAGIELLFTPKEEVGLQGAAAFDHERLHARLGFVYDQAEPIGGVILGAPHSQAMEVRFHGRASHSGMFPEEGRSAIAAAARAIADLRLGRVDEISTANVGTITGGTAGNIVPEWCTFVAEVRSHDEAKLAGYLQEMLDAYAFAASAGECEVETTTRKSYTGYSFKQSDEVVRVAAAALRRAGHEPRYGLSGGAADANVFNERGLPCINLANGMTAIHTPDEHITVADLEAMVEVTLALVDEAVAQPWPRHGHGRPGAARGPRPARGRRHGDRRVPAAHRAGRARRRRARQRAGPRARPRLGRLRRAAREPHARARPPARAGSARDEAAVHLAPGRRLPRRGGRRRWPDRWTGCRSSCCSVRGQLAPVCAGLAGARVAYLQLPGGALPVSLSDSVRELKARGLLETAVAVGACTDGDVACVSVASALAWAAGVGFDAAVCSVGPGIVGTGSPLGHGALAAADAANAASALGGTPVIAARVSDADERERHRGVSHHTRAVLALSLGRPVVAWPRGAPARPTGWSRARRSTRRAGATRVRGCRSRTWAGAPTRSRRSSPPPTLRGSSRGGARDGGAPRRVGLNRVPRSPRGSRRPRRSAPGSRARRRPAKCRACAPRLRRAPARRARRIRPRRGTAAHEARRPPPLRWPSATEAILPRRRPGRGPPLAGGPRRRSADVVSR